MRHSPTFLDLFCGCGGFSLGLERAGFKGLAAIAILIAASLDTSPSSAFGWAR